jgi:tRNA threonylcarbamoyladenosine biosynthesis protein TsaE
MKKNTMNGWVVVTESRDETLRLAQVLGKHLAAADWISLTGELGTGKTLFAQGLARGAGCKVPVVSPTFSLIQSYPIKNKMFFHHADLYRLNPGEVQQLEWDIVKDGSGPVAVEWAEKAKSIWPADVLTVALQHAGQDKRRVQFAPSGPRSAALIKLLKKDIR